MEGIEQFECEVYASVSGQSHDNVQSSQHMHWWYLADLRLGLDLMTPPLHHHHHQRSAAPSLQIEHASVCSSNQHTSVCSLYQHASVCSSYQHAVTWGSVMSGVIVCNYTVPAGSKSASCMLRFRLRDLF